MDHPIAREAQLIEESQQSVQRQTWGSQKKRRCR
jgi:hypothetical protein